MEPITHEMNTFIHYCLETLKNLERMSKKESGPLITAIQLNFSSLERVIQEHIPEWAILRTRGKLRIHTLKVLGSLAIDEEYWGASERDQFILAWGCLLHDISKRKSPEVRGKDRFHPFACCATSLVILSRLGEIHIEPDRLQEIYDFIMGSKTEDERMDNSKLKTILNLLYSVFNLIPSPDTPWESYAALTEGVDMKHYLYLEILLIILFHQSFTVVKLHPAATPLTPSEIDRFMSGRLLWLLKVLMKSDSLSYLLKNPSRMQQYKSIIEESYFMIIESFRNR